jgi:hypothetical protein
MIAWLATLQQHRVLLWIMVEELHGAVAVPYAECFRLVVRLLVCILNLEHSGRAISTCSRKHYGDEGLREWWREFQIPVPHTPLHARRQFAQPLARGRKIAHPGKR